MAYSTKLGNKRYIISSIVNNKGIRIVKAAFDTGAMRTVYCANDIGCTLDDVNKAEYVDLHGFDKKASPFRAYKYKVRQYTIGTVDLGSCEIWVTFDARIADSVVGMDILEHISFGHTADSKELYIYDREANVYDDKSNAIYTPAKVVGEGVGEMTVNGVKCRFNFTDMHKDNIGRYIEIGIQRCYFA